MNKKNKINFNTCTGIGVKLASGLVPLLASTPVRDISWKGEILLCACSGHALNYHLRTAWTRLWFNEVTISN